MKKTIKKMSNSLLCLAVIASTLICTSTSVMAAEANNVTPIVEGDRGNFANDPVNERDIPSGYEFINGETARASGIYGYAAGHLTSSYMNFKVNAPGTGTSRGGISIKTHGFSSNSARIEVTLKRPDGSVAKTYILTGNMMVENLSFSNAPAGEYTVAAAISGTPGGYVSVWVFSM